MTLSEILDLVLTISPWDWSFSYPDHTVLSAILVQPGKRVTIATLQHQPPISGIDGRFIAASPHIVGELIMMVVEEKSYSIRNDSGCGSDNAILLALKELSITPEKWAELKKRLEGK